MAFLRPIITALCIIVLSVRASQVKRITFRKALDCYGNPGCANDYPLKILTDVKSKLHCAVKCLITDVCVSFGYARTSLICQMFKITPHKIGYKKDCTSYDSDLFGPFRKPGENLSKYRRTCLSKEAMFRNYSLNGWLAVDDSYGTDQNLGLCAGVFGTDSENNWFMADLVRLVTIDYVQILGRKLAAANQSVRYDNITIGVTNNTWLVIKPIKKQYPLCGVYLGPKVDASWFNITCQPSTPPSRYVIVHQAQVFSIDGGFLTLCEFQVYGTYS